MLAPVVPVTWLAVSAFKIGVSSRASMIFASAELARGRAMARQKFGQCPGRLLGSVTGHGCRVRDVLHESICVTGAAVGQSVEVAACVRKQHRCQRDGHSSGQPASTQDRADQSAADAAVAVGERVDGLELGVRDRGLSEYGQICSIGEGEQIGHQFVDEFRRRWHVQGVDRGVIAAPDPVLHVADNARIARGVEVRCHQQSVRGREIVTGDRTFACGVDHRRQRMHGRKLRFGLGVGFTSCERLAEWLRFPMLSGLPQ